MISSTWRHGQTAMGMTQVVGVIGLKPGLHRDWCTPRLYGQIRGMEIQQWLEDHPEETRWVIVDDCTDMLAGQMSRFIQTHPDDGITAEVYQTGKVVIDNLYE